MRKNNFNIICCLIVAAAIASGAAIAKAEGSALGMSPSAGTYPLNTTFSVSIKLNSGDQAINSTDGSLIFDNTKLEVVNIGTANSILSFWFPAEPTFSNQAGTINFSGGLPSPGFKGSNATLLTINFKAKAVGDAQLSFTSGSILANDGKGSNILTSMGSASFKIVPATEPPKTEEQPAVETKKAEQPEEAAETSQPAIQLNSSLIRSPSHPKQEVWYKNRNIEMQWDLPDGAQGISYIFDNNSNSEPPEKSEGLFGEKKFEDIKDGVWYFHLKIKTAAGWGETYTYRIMIDSTSPRMLEIKIDEKDPGEWPIIFFNAKDDESGIVRYELKVSSLEEKAYEIVFPETSFELKNLGPGEHNALVKAIDGAGNEIIMETTFTIKPIETPLFDKFPVEAESSDQLYFAGKTLPDVTVKVYIQNDAGQIIAREARSDAAGNWYYIFDNGLENGRYVAWAEAVNKNGIASLPSEKASFLISPPVFARLGNLVVNYFTVFASLLFMIVLIAASVIFLVYFVRKKLRKETFEIEKVLARKLSELRIEINGEFAKLSKTGPAALKSERIRAKIRIDEKLDSAEKKILKEIKDVEDIVK